MVASQRGQSPDRHGDVLLLDLGERGLPALEEGVAAHRHDEAHLSDRAVATMAALIVCSRFSAWSNTIEAGDSKTSSVTSSAVEAPLVEIWLPTSVSRLWRAGRQCRNFTSGLPVAFMSSALTW